MYALQLLSTPSQDFGKLIGLGVVCGFYGMFFAIPLRKFYILRQRLVFPDATATSVAIRTLHLSKSDVRKPLICLAVSFAASMIWTVASTYAEGILFHWSFFYWISLFAGPAILSAHNWGWGIVETSPCMYGFGLIVGLNGSLSFYLGAILAWGILGPITVATGVTAGKEAGPHQWSYWAPSYGSPRYWLLWPGVFIMICSSLAEIMVNYKTIWGGIKAGVSDLYNTIRRRPLSGISSDGDPAAPADQVPIWVGPYIHLLTFRLGPLVS
jgi:uncharacterized oligopeptide transporter (OPT) family protein